MARKPAPAPSIGHNAMNSQQRGELKTIIERIERLAEERKGISDDIRDIYKESKEKGFDAKALRAIVTRRKQDAEKLREHEAIVEVYRHALGDFVTTELGQSAIERAMA